MTTDRRPLPSATRLTDTAIRQALLELAAGPDATILVRDVVRAAATTQQVRGLRWPGGVSRRPLALGLVALVALALVGGALLAGGLIPSPTPPLASPSVTTAPPSAVASLSPTAAPSAPPPSTPSPSRPAAFEPPDSLSTVVQTWNHLAAPDAVVMHTAFAAGSDAGVWLGGALSSTAISPRWSPDGSRLVYFESTTGRGLADGVRLGATDLFVADRDGANPVRVRAPRAANLYPTGWWAGAVWSPTGAHFALPWSTGECTGGTDCLPPGGIDVFDASGTLVETVATTSDDGRVVWSPDGSAIGWTTTTCLDSRCSTESFSWRRIDGSDPNVTTLDVPGAAQVAWASRGILVVAVDTAGAFDRAYWMEPDGCCVRDMEPGSVIGRFDPTTAVWSPDGRSILGFDERSGQILIRNLETESMQWNAVPPGLGVAAWAPDSSRVIFIGFEFGASADYEFFAIPVSAEGYQSLGPGDDFGWLPAQGQ